MAKYVKSIEQFNCNINLRSNYKEISIKEGGKCLKFYALFSLFDLDVGRGITSHKTELFNSTIYTYINIYIYKYISHLIFTLVCVYYTF
jgi:hypothetical protein